MLGVSLHGGQERLSCEAVKVKPELYWRPQDFGDAKVMQYQSWRAAYRVWDQPKRRKCVAVNKAGGVGVLKTALTSNMGIQNLESAWLWWFLVVVPFLHFWN